MPSRCSRVKNELWGGGFSALSLAFSGGGTAANDARGSARTRQAISVRSSNPVNPAPATEAQYGSSHSGGVGDGRLSAIRPHPSRTGRLRHFSSYCCHFLSAVSQVESSAS